MTTDATFADRIRRAVAHPVVVRIHLDTDDYCSAECSFGAHHACPGGLRVGLVSGEIVRLHCQCIAQECACWLRRSSVEQAPGLDLERSGKG
ncbi:hypothetical protein ACFYST_30515 [Kitasatospora sp. NPDC004614]|uniref:hypothetical protein n=1 Tax=unclassified Kitasatospora TaxID=2633591 RepID=UPI0036B4BEFA